MSRSTDRISLDCSLADGPGTLFAVLQVSGVCWPRGFWRRRALTGRESVSQLLAKQGAPSRRPVGTGGSRRGFLGDAVTALLPLC